MAHWSECPTGVCSRSCCRYKSQHNAINCDAARRKYTSDYLVINECQTDGCPLSPPSPPAGQRTCLPWPNATALIHQ